LAGQAEKEAAGQVDEQRAVRKSTPRANLHEPLEAVARQRANSPENGNQHELQSASIPKANQKLQKPRDPKRRGKQPGATKSGSRSHRPVLANSICFPFRLV